jgi:hypothetical protein
MVLRSLYLISEVGTDPGHVFQLLVGLRVGPLAEVSRRHCNGGIVKVCESFDEAFPSDAQNLMCS